MIGRFTAMPGDKWVRAATCLAMIDEPFRFNSKSALWRYLGIGLERKPSGKGPVWPGVPNQCKRVLKGEILGGGMLFDGMLHQRRHASCRWHTKQETRN
jgi:hypothetical protein